MLGRAPQHPRPRCTCKVVAMYTRVNFMQTDAMGTSNMEEVLPGRCAHHHAPQGSYCDARRLTTQHHVQRHPPSARPYPDWLRRAATQAATSDAACAMVMPQTWSAEYLPGGPTGARPQHVTHTRHIRKCGSNYVSPHVAREVIDGRRVADPGGLLDSPRRIAEGKLTVARPW